LKNLNKSTVLTSLSLLIESWKKNCDSNFKNMGTKCTHFHKSRKFFCSVIHGLIHHVLKFVPMFHLFIQESLGNSSLDNHPCPFKCVCVCSFSFICFCYHHEVCIRGLYFWITWRKSVASTQWDQFTGGRAVMVSVTSFCFHITTAAHTFYLPHPVFLMSLGIPKWFYQLQYIPQNIACD
jgi:hypothetical protein